MTVPHLLIVDRFEAGPMVERLRADGHDVDVADGDDDPATVFPGHTYDAVVLGTIGETNRARWHDRLQDLAPGMPVYDKRLDGSLERTEAVLDNIELAWEAHL